MIYNSYYDSNRYRRRAYPSVFFFQNDYSGRLKLQSSFKSKELRFVEWEKRLSRLVSLTKSSLTVSRFSVRGKGKKKRIEKKAAMS